MNKSFTAKDFLKALAEGSLVEPITWVGMVKPDADDQEAFLFSEGSACGRWLKIPAEVVENMEILGKVQCQDHEHPVVRLHLKEPPKDNVFARVFADMARRSRPQPKQSVHSRALSAARPGAAFESEEFGLNCFYVNYGGKIYLCCDGIGCSGIG